MKYFNTKHEKNSAKLTALITVVILLLLFVVGPPYMDPPEEYGIAVNFGSTNYGKGDVQPKKTIKLKSKAVSEPEQLEPVKEKPLKPLAVKENVLTANNTEEIAIKKQKEIEAKKAKAEEEIIRKAKIEANKKAKEQQEKEAKKRKLDALIGGVSKSKGSDTGGEGDDDKAGDKGQLNGNPYAPSYFGTQGSGNGGVGYGLNGRGRATYKTIKQNCNESGRVVVRIEVDRKGNVIKAEPGVKGTTNNSACLLEPAKKIALSHKWPENRKAPERQIGFVKVNFKLGQ